MRYAHLLGWLEVQDKAAVAKLRAQLPATPTSSHLPQRLEGCDRVALGHVHSSDPKASA